MGGGKLIQDFIVPALLTKRFDDLLKWDETPGEFLIKWTHKAKSTWTTELSLVFKEWDRFKGRPEPITDQELVNSKQRLRAALRNIKTIEEVKCAPHGYKKYFIKDFVEEDKSSVGSIKQEMKKVIKQETRPSFSHVPVSTEASASRKRKAKVVATMYAEDDDDPDYRPRKTRKRKSKKRPTQRKKRVDYSSDEEEEVDNPHENRTEEVMVQSPPPYPFRRRSTRKCPVPNKPTDQFNSETQTNFCEQEAACSSTMTTSANSNQVPRLPARRVKIELKIETSENEQKAVWSNTMTTVESQQKEFCATPADPSSIASGAGINWERELPWNYSIHQELTSDYLEQTASRYSYALMDMSKMGFIDIMNDPHEDIFADELRMDEDPGVHATKISEVSGSAEQHIIPAEKIKTETKEIKKEKLSDYYEQAPSRYSMALMDHSQTECIEIHPLQFNFFDEVRIEDDEAVGATPYSECSASAGQDIFPVKKLKTEAVGAKINSECLASVGQDIFPVQKIKTEPVDDQIKLPSRKTKVSQEVWADWWIRDEDQDIEVIEHPLRRSKGCKVKQKDGVRATKTSEGAGIPVQHIIPAEKIKTEKAEQASDVPKDVPPTSTASNKKPAKQKSKAAQASLKSRAVKKEKISSSKSYEGSIGIGQASSSNASNTPATLQPYLSIYPPEKSVPCNKQSEKISSSKSYKGSIGIGQASSSNASNAPPTLQPYLSIYPPEKSVPCNEQSEKISSSKSYEGSIGIGQASSSNASITPPTLQQYLSIYPPEKSVPCNEQSDEGFIDNGQASSSNASNTPPVLQPYLSIHRPCQYNPFIELDEIIPTIYSDSKPVADGYDFWNI